MPATVAATTWTSSAPVVVVANTLPSPSAVAKAARPVTADAIAMRATEDATRRPSRLPSRRRITSSAAIVAIVYAVVCPKASPFTPRYRK